MNITKIGAPLFSGNYSHKFVRDNHQPVFNGKSDNKRSSNTSKILLGSGFILSAATIIVLIKKGKIFRKPENLKLNGINDDIVAAGSPKAGTATPHARAAAEASATRSVQTLTERTEKLRAEIDNNIDRVFPSDIEKKAVSVKDNEIVPDYIVGNKKYTFDNNNKRVEVVTYYDPKSRMSKREVYATDISKEQCTYVAHRGGSTREYNIGDLIEEAYYRGNLLEDKTLKPFWTTSDGMKDKNPDFGSRRVIKQTQPITGASRVKLAKE